MSAAGMTGKEQQSSFPYDGMTRSGSKGFSQSAMTADTPNERLQVTGNTGKMQERVFLA
jgi:hypothetical protein